MEEDHERVKESEMIVLDPHGFEMELEEDVGAAVEDFVLYSRLGLTDDAYAVIEEVLWRHLLFFPVLAEIGLFLVERNDMEHLRQILALLQRRKSDYLKSYTSDEKAFVETLEIALSLDKTSPTALQELPDKLKMELIKLSLYAKLESQTPTQTQIVQMYLTLSPILSSFEDLLEAASAQFYRLVGGNEAWEPTYIFKLLCSKFWTVSSASVTSSIPQLGRMYEIIMQLVDEPKLSSLTDTDVDENVPELICCMIAKASFAQALTDFEDTVSRIGIASFDHFEIATLRAAARRSLSQLLRCLPDGTIRGMYAESLGLLADTTRGNLMIDGPVESHQKHNVGPEATKFWISQTSGSAADATSLTDEHRGRKAEASLPGTSDANVNLESFQHRLKYSADDPDTRRDGISSPRRPLIAPSLANSFSKNRLPPVARTGCWVCRSRKVKCDEGRPICGQCSRLGHACDYNPRLSFRDNTLRAKEHMATVTVVGSAVWDRMASSAPSSAGSTIDDLASSATLLTDEDLERKAEAALPGYFNFIVDPESFQHMAEYSPDDLDPRRNGILALRRPSVAASPASSFSRDSITEAITIPGDPNTVILPRFEDLSRRSIRELKSLTSPTAINTRLQIKREESNSSFNIRGSEIATLRRFRNVVWKQLIPPEHGPDSSIVLLDEAAAHFPPLIRAMMALGSLAVFQRDGKERFDSLQYFSQTLPELQNSLKNEEDLASDGAFLTHLLILVYEIATGDIEHPNIWPHHISTLLKITLLRRRIYGAERFPFIVWWICSIDLDALLSGLGEGEFVGHMLKNDLIPPPSFHLYPLGVDGSSVVFPEERETLPTVLQLDYEVTLRAIRLGLLANEFRRDTSFEKNDARHRDMTVKIRQSQISDIQGSLQHLWTIPAVQELGHIRLPPRAQRLFYHAWTLYRACIIYSHTSMWPGQRLFTSQDYTNEITTASQQILNVSQIIMADNPGHCRFLVFPLFMAGFASDIGNQKMMALNFIQQMEGECIGQNTQVARKALETIYERQNERFMHTGNSLGVDWLHLMMEQGLTVVNFGL